MRTTLRSLLAASLALLLSLPLAAIEPQVRVVRSTGWSEGDPVKEGASEFVILLEVARLTRSATPGGLVGVGDRRGLFGPGAEQAMEQAVLQGVPVVKLAPSGRVLPAPHGLFIDGGSLSEEEACAVLAKCLATHGALSAGRESPDAAELRARLKLYQNEFTLASGTRLAVR